MFYEVVYEIFLYGLFLVLANTRKRRTVNNHKFFNFVSAVISPMAAYLFIALMNYHGRSFHVMVFWVVFGIIIVFSGCIGGWEEDTWSLPVGPKLISSDILVHECIIWTTIFTLLSKILKYSWLPVIGHF